MNASDKGFVFDIYKCVACRACAAACVVENKWNVRPRSVLTMNSEALPGLPLFHLSIACNHCRRALCLEGCPASAYSRNADTNAVVIDDSKCLGCRYCQWNCPYDSPKFDTDKKVVGKCNFCNQLLEEGMNPACVSACPTGALSFGNLRNDRKVYAPGWFPDRNMDPSLTFSGTTNPQALRIEPESRFSCPETPKPEPGKSPGSEWSLIVFSFLSSLSVAYLASSVISGTVINLLLHVLLLVSAASASLYHLGKPMRAWRALINLRTSPLSREIWCFLIYSLLSSASVITQSPLLTIIAAATGLLLLVLIDGIYFYADPRIVTLLNSGQTLLSALLISSYLAGELVAFLFIAGLRIILSLNKLLHTRTYSSLRFVRTGLLFAISVFLTGNSASFDSFIFVVFLIGELIDRVLFYIDFSPLNISKEFSISKL